MASRSRTLYTGVTSNLDGRVAEHKLKLVPGFTSRHNIDRLVYFECHGDIRRAIQREKQIKGWTRAKKLALIASMNPGWCDLSEGWFGKGLLVPRDDEVHRDRSAIRPPEFQPLTKP